jgi:hypothetical protein
MVDEREAREMRRDAVAVEPELSAAFGSEVCRLPDGSAIVVLAMGGGIWHPSYTDLLASYRAAVAPPERGVYDRPVDVYGKDDVLSAPERLQSRLGLAPSAADWTVQSLAMLDASMHHMKASEVLAPSVFAPLLAYVGEVIRRALNGRWYFAAAGPRGHEPAMIIGVHGERCAIADLYGELLEGWPAVGVGSYVELKLGERSSSSTS